MDSITQIVLGAAIGEIYLGKKLGNRAMIWGAIAGTIPDLDIIGNLFMTELNALAFHRGISHSIFFAVFFPFLIAGYTHWFYGNKYHHKKPVRIGFTALNLGFLALIGIGISSVFRIVSGTSGMLISGFFLMSFIGWFGFRLWNNYVEKKPMQLEISYKEWYIFFFLTIVTHPLLDCFTAYGTQLFAPFTDYRVAFNNISVADPLYTLPFLICLLLASRKQKIDSKRRFLTFLGIGISSAYMLLTIGNKFRTDSILKDTLAQNQISYSRFTTNPSILNNLLWAAAVETEEGFYLGNYSIFDKEQRFKLRKIPKNYTLVNNKLNDPTIKRLRWFTNNFFGFITRKDGRIQMNDLRYGKFEDKGNSESDYIFRFILKEKEDGSYHLEQSMGGPDNEDRSSMLGSLWHRMKGI